MEDSRVLAAGVRQHPERLHEFPAVPSKWSPPESCTWKNVKACLAFLDQIRTFGALVRGTNSTKLPRSRSILKYVALFWRNSAVHESTPTAARTQDTLAQQCLQTRNNTHIWMNRKSFKVCEASSAKISAAILLQFVYDSNTPQSINSPSHGQVLRYCQLGVHFNSNNLRSPALRHCPPSNSTENDNAHDSHWLPRTGSHRRF